MDASTMSSRKNSITSLSTTNSGISNQPGSTINSPNSQIRTIDTNNLISIDSKFVRKNVKKSKGDLMFKNQGTYYFPNGEVFRPRGAPTRRQKPRKINDISDSDNMYHYVPNASSGSNVATSQVSRHSVHGHLSSPNSSSNLTKVSSMDSIASVSNIPRSYSLNNMRKMNNNKSLAQSLRTNKADTPTNITLFQQHLSQQHQQHQPGQLPQQYSQQFQQFQQFQISGNMHSHPPNHNFTTQDHHLHSNNSSSTSLKNLQSTNLVKNLSLFGSKPESLETNTKSDSNLSTSSTYTLNRSTSNTPQTSVSTSAEEDRENSDRSDNSRPNSLTTGEDSLSMVKEVRNENQEEVSKNPMSDSYLLPKISTPTVFVTTPETESVEEFSTPLNATPVNTNYFDALISPIDRVEPDSEIITDNTINEEIPEEPLIMPQSERPLDKDGKFLPHTTSTVSSVYSSVDDNELPIHQLQAFKQPEWIANRTPPASITASVDELTPTPTTQFASPKGSPEMAKSNENSEKSIVSGCGIFHDNESHYSSTESSSVPSPTSSGSRSGAEMDDLLNSYQSESPLSKPPRMSPMPLARDVEDHMNEGDSLNADTTIVEEHTEKESSPQSFGSLSDSTNNYVDSRYESADELRNDVTEMPSPTVSDTESTNGYKPVTLKKRFRAIKSPSIESLNDPFVDSQDSFDVLTSPFQEKPGFARDVSEVAIGSPIIEATEEEGTEEDASEDKSLELTEAKKSETLAPKPKSMLDVVDKPKVRSMLAVSEPLTPEEPVSEIKAPPEPKPDVDAPVLESVITDIPLEIAYDSPQKVTLVPSPPRTPTREIDMKPISIDNATEEELNRLDRLQKSMDKSLPSTPSSKQNEMEVRNSKSMMSLPDKKSIWKKVFNKRQISMDSSSLKSKFSLERTRASMNFSRNSFETNSVSSKKSNQEIPTTSLGSSFSSVAGQRLKKLSNTKRSFSIKDLKLSSFAKRQEPAPPLPKVEVPMEQVGEEEKEVEEDPEPIISSEELTLTKLPSFEAEENIFDDMLNTFDVELERVGRKPTVKPKPLNVTEPFLMDDELTRDQIEDQQLKDKLNGSRYRSNSEDYIDENLEFLREELIWPIDTMSDVKSFKSAEETVTDTSKSSESEELVGGEEDIFFIEKEQLTNLFNNVSESQRRKLPMHLKYIKQFKDYSVLEINIKKFENLTNSKLIIKDQKVTSILRKKTKYGGRETLNSRVRNLKSPNVKPKVQFSNKLSINETFSPDLYSRYNKSVTQYTLTEPIEIARIKNEMNDYKCNEMLVHEQSQNNTHFFY